MRSRCRVGIALLALAASACDSTPTEPTQVPLPPTLLQIVDWNFGTSTTTARVQALWLVFEGPPVDVTARATWESSAPGVMGIEGPGRIVTLATGEADLRVTYQGAVKTHYFRVYAGEPPWPAFRAGEAVSIGDTVRDASNPSSPQGIGGVTLEIISGHNAGRVFTTDATGWYTLHPPFTCGPITMRATKAGYLDATASSVMCQSGMPKILMTPAS